MDKKLFGSVITVLVLLSVLWVIGASTIGTADEYDSVSNGTILNWSALDDSTVTNADPTNFTVNFSIRPNLKLATHKKSYTLNITNITIMIRPAGYFNITLTNPTPGVNASVNDTMVYHPTTGDKVFNTSIFMCKVRQHGTTSQAVECLNDTDSIAGGNYTIDVFFGMEQNTTTSAQGYYTWEVWVHTNATDTYTDSDTYSHETFPFGVDDLAPQIVALNVSDGTNVREMKNGDFNGTGNSWVKNADLNVSITVREYNRNDNIVQIAWHWNGTAATKRKGPLNADNDNIRGLGFEPKLSYNMTLENRGGKCKRFAGATSYSDCVYSFVIDSGNLTNDDTNFSIVFWANDSFGHEANFTNGNLGYNLSIDGANPSISEITLSRTNIYVTDPMKISCKGSDISGATTTVTITKPNKDIIQRRVTSADGHEITLSGTETSAAGRYYVDCRTEDAVRNVRRALQKSFTVYFSDDISIEAGDGAAPSKVADVVVSTTAEHTGLVSGKQGESKTFSIDGTKVHTITFLEVSFTSAKMTIESDPVELTLDIGKFSNVDLDGDGTDDVKVTLTAIDENGFAKVEVINLEKKAQREREDRGEVTTPEAEAAGKAGLWITILVILVVIGVGYYLLKGKKGKKGQVKFSKQDLGL